MFYPFPNFEWLNRNKRVKFLDISGKIFAYNVKDSYLVQVNNQREFSKEIIKTSIPPVKTLILHVTYECNLKCRHCYINAGPKMTYEMDVNELSKIVNEHIKEYEEKEKDG